MPQWSILASYHFHIIINHFNNNWQFEMILAKMLDMFKSVHYIWVIDWIIFINLPACQSCSLFASQSAMCDAP